MTDNIAEITSLVHTAEMKMSERITGSIKEAVMQDLRFSQWSDESNDLRSTVRGSLVFDVSRLRGDASVKRRSALPHDYQHNITTGKFAAVALLDAYMYNHSFEPRNSLLPYVRLCEIKGEPMVLFTVHDKDMHMVNNYTLPYVLLSQEEAKVVDGIFSILDIR